MSRIKYLISIKIDMYEDSQTLHVIGNNDVEVINKLYKTFKNRSDIHLEIIKKEPINESR